LNGEIKATFHHIYESNGKTNAPNGKIEVTIYKIVVAIGKITVTIYKIVVAIGKM
jgi:hypothetical protein